MKSNEQNIIRYLGLNTDFKMLLDKIKVKRNPQLHRLINSMQDIRGARRFQIILGRRAYELKQYNEIVEALRLLDCDPISEADFILKKVMEENAGRCLQCGKDCGNDRWLSKEGYTFCSESCINIYNCPVCHTSVEIDIDPKSIEVKDLYTEREKLKAMKKYLVDNDMALLDKSEAVRILGWYWKAGIIPSAEDMDLYMRLNKFTDNKGKGIPPVNTPSFTIKDAVKRMIGDSEYVDLVVEDNVGKVFVTTIALKNGVQITLEGKGK